MEAQIYKSASARRPTLRAVFAKAARWGEERGGHHHEPWILDEEVDLARPNRTLPFSPSEALDAVKRDGVFFFQVPATWLLQQQHILLNSYRLKFTLPLFADTPSLRLLGTGTLFEHEGRHFIVTADHIFREDENDPHSQLIDMTSVAAPTDPRPSTQGSALMFTLGEHVIYHLPPPVVVDAIVVELKSKDTVATLKNGWGFLNLGAAEPLRPDDDRFVITGFLWEGLRFKDNVVSQAMLNLETDFYVGEPNVKYPVPDLDLFLHLQQNMVMVDGQARSVQSIKGLSGGPIWAVRDVDASSVWHPSKAMKIVAVQSSELQSKEKWARGVRWEAIRAIFRSKKVGFSACF